MQHPGVDQLIPLVLEPHQTPTYSHALLNHLEGCDQCLSLLTSLEETVKLLIHADTQAVPNLWMTILKQLPVSTISCVSPTKPLCEMIKLN